MDLKAEYEPLTQKLLAALPLIAKPERRLVQGLRLEGRIITLNTKLLVIDVTNMGDTIGIACTIMDTAETSALCSLTHLIFSPGTPLYKEITDYQKKRIKFLLS